MVQGIIAGGEAALTHSIEGAEDDGQAGEDACKAHHLTSKDVLIGITANGGAPFVVQALRYAKSLGCAISAISCNQVTPVFDLVEPKMRIYLPVGPEIISRLDADDERNGAEAGAEHDYHDGDDPAGEGV
jgi:N-acetylmuramic acid 6-phosphate etherase